MSMRTPRRFGCGLLGAGSLNGKVVAEKATRWWFRRACFPADWARGETSSLREDTESAEVVWWVWRLFWNLEEERRLEVRKRRRRLRVRTERLVVGTLMRTRWKTYFRAG
jgi:hypothetical protein